MKYHRVKITILVRPATAFHLKQMAKEGARGDIGRAVDKLVRDRMVLIREGMQILGRQKNAPEESGAE